MLRHQVLDAYSKVQRRTVVVVDVRKAFDTVPHEAVIRSAEHSGVCGHLLNFVKSFLKDRAYKIKAGDYTGPAQPNRTGVPHGAVLLLTLFNLVMARLPPLLEAVPSLHFTLSQAQRKEAQAKAHNAAGAAPRARVNPGESRRRNSSIRSRVSVGAADVVILSDTEHIKKFYSSKNAVFRPSNALIEELRRSNMGSSCTKQVHSPSGCKPLSSSRMGCFMRSQLRQTGPSCTKRVDPPSKTASRFLQAAQSVLRM
ncbi:hypothetical protein ISCGN_008428 [Ixodes scapularis]